MKRAGALLGVVVMVAAAFFVRGAFTDDDPAAAPGGDGGGQSSAAILCPTDLADVCRASGLDVSTAGAGTTADALLTADGVNALDTDAWIVPATWARVVIDERRRLGRPALFEVAGEPLASTGVALAIWTDRDADLATRCAEVDWRCLAEQEGATLGTGDRVRPAGPPVDSAGGLSIAASQMGAVIGLDDYAANDFDGTVLALADRLARGQSNAPLRTMRSRGPGQITATGVLAADASDLSSSFGAIQPRFEDGVRVDVVALVPAGGSLSEERRGQLTDAFTAAGWDPPGTGADGLPDGSVLAAVRTLWNDAR